MLSRVAASKQGLRDEINVAVQHERARDLARFVIPVRIDDFPLDQLYAPISRKYVISFRPSWAQGLDELLDALQKDAVPTSKPGPDATREWLEALNARPKDARGNPSTVFTNWLPISRVPDTINFIRLPRNQQPNAPLGRFPFPVVPYEDMIITWATDGDVNAYLPSWIRCTVAHQFAWRDFLNGSLTSVSKVTGADTSRWASSLLRQAWDVMAREKGLMALEGRGSYVTWYWSIEGVRRATFMDTHGKRHARNLTGHSPRHQAFWHYGIQARPILRFGEAHFGLVVRVLFTKDGYREFYPTQRAHALRRRYCRSWWNDRWRDLMLAYVQSLVGEPTVATPLYLTAAPNQHVTVSPRPLILAVPQTDVGIERSAD